jgi:hypothetical protein
MGMRTATARNEAKELDATTCGRCAARYGHAGWVALPLVRRLDSGQLSLVTSRWPTGVAVEVRRCACCGASIARTRPGASA